MPPDDFIFNRFDRPDSATATETPEMQRRAALVVVVITPALLITGCKSSSKSKVTAPLSNVSAISIGDLVTGTSPATITALKDQAQVVLGRI